MFEIFSIVFVIFWFFILIPGFAILQPIIKKHKRKKKAEEMKKRWPWMTQEDIDCYFPKEY